MQDQSDDTYESAHFKQDTDIVQEHEIMYEKYLWSSIAPGVELGRNLRGPK